MNRGHRIPLDGGPPWLTLAAAILHRTPRLPGARCVGQPQVFDGHDDASRDAPVELCNQCPALAQCESWVRSLPPTRRPSGVVAAKYRILIGPR